MNSTVAAVSRPFFAPACNLPTMSELRRRVAADDTTNGTTMAATTTITTTSSHHLTTRTSYNLQPTAGSVANVRRNLFGPVDHDENKRLLQQQMEKLSKEAKDKWNYDFLNDKPIDGRFEWKEADISQVPAVYDLRHLQSTSSTSMKALAKPSVSTTSGAFNSVSLRSASIQSKNSAAVSSTKKSRALKVSASSSGKARRNLSFTSEDKEDKSDVVVEEKDDSLNNNNIRLTVKEEDTNNSNNSSSNNSANNEEQCNVKSSSSSIPRITLNSSSKQTNITGEYNRNSGFHSSYYYYKLLSFSLIYGYQTKFK